MKQCNVGYLLALVFQDAFISYFRIIEMISIVNTGVSFGLKLLRFSIFNYYLLCVEIVSFQSLLLPLIAIIFVVLWVG